MLDQTVVDRITDAVMREQAEMAQAVSSQREFSVIYVDQEGDLQYFQFTGKPSGLIDELEQRGVDLDKGQFARCSVGPDGIRQFVPEKGDLRDRLEQAVAADETHRKAQKLADAS